MVFNNYYCKGECFKKNKFMRCITKKHKSNRRNHISYLTWSSLPKGLAEKYLLTRFLELLENYSKTSDTNYLINFKNTLKKYNRFLTTHIVDKLLLSEWCTIECANELLTYNCCALNDNIYIFDLNNEVIDATQKYSNTKYWGIMYKKKSNKNEIELDKINNTLATIFSKLTIKHSIKRNSYLEKFNNLRI